MNTDQPTGPIATIAVPKEKKLVRWLIKATVKRGHPALENVSKKDDLVMATDGIRLHAAQAPHCMDDLPDTREGQANYLPDVATKHIVWEPSAEDFPSLVGILPQGELIATIVVNPRYLTEALAGFKGDNFVLLSIHIRQPDSDYPKTQLVVQSSKGEAKYALIMGMRRRSGANQPWAPSFEEPKTEEATEDG